MSKDLFRAAIYKGLRFVWEIVPFLDSNGVIWRNGKWVNGCKLLKTLVGAWDLNPDSYRGVSEFLKIAINSFAPK